MKIAKDAVVSMHYTLKNPAGEIVDSSEGQEPLVFLQGHGNIIPGLEAAIEGKAVGDTLDVTIPPAEGYGDRHDELVQKAPLNAFEGIDDLAVGMQLEAMTEQGPVPVHITAIEGDEVTVDGNHQLAGVELNFNIKVENIREATADELEHGHVHTEACSH
ncbi:MAG: peptidylprolyl isomerase [Pseudomonadota bacterium]